VFTQDEVRMNQLKASYKDTFNRSTLDEEKTLEFYYNSGKQEEWMDIFM
jgi:hypothetical protein